jgi:putative FmdB family regulatory protein
MPVYSYECLRCSLEVERVVKTEARDCQLCPCKFAAPMRRNLSTPAMVELKGSGEQYVRVRNPTGKVLR